MKTTFDRLSSPSLSIIPLSGLRKSASPNFFLSSPAVKWFVEEGHSREARLLRDAYADGLIDVAAPSLLPYEALNALKYSGAFGEEGLKEEAQALDDFQLTLYDLEDELALKAVEVAMGKGITIYGASYVALGWMLDADTYTADEKLFKRTRWLGFVKYVADFKI